MVLELTELTTEGLQELVGEIIGTLVGIFGEMEEEVIFTNLFILVADGLVKEHFKKIDYDRGSNENIYILTPTTEEAFAIDTFVTYAGMQLPEIEELVRIAQPDFQDPECPPELAEELAEDIGEIMGAVTVLFPGCERHQWIERSMPRFS